MSKFYDKNLIDVCLTELLGDFANNSFWKNRTVNSICGIGALFKTIIYPQNIIRTTLQSNEIWVVSEDELDFNIAKCGVEYIINNKIFPIVVLEIEKEYYLYMGSARSVSFCLKGLPIDTIIVKTFGLENSNFKNNRCKKLNYYVEQYNGN